MCADLVLYHLLFHASLTVLRLAVLVVVGSTLLQHTDTHLLVAVCMSESSALIYVLDPSQNTYESCARLQARDRKSTDPNVYENDARLSVLPAELMK